MSDLYEIRYLPTAEGDLEEIFEYIMQDNPSAAASLLEKFDEVIAPLAHNPYLDVVPRDDRLRKLVYRMLIVGDYLVFHMVKSGTVQIRRIIHGARNYRFLL